MAALFSADPEAARARTPALVECPPAQATLPPPLMAWLELGTGDEHGEEATRAASRRRRTRAAEHDHHVPLEFHRDVGLQVGADRAAVRRQPLGRFVVAPHPGHTTASAAGSGHTGAWRPRATRRLP